MDQLTFDHVSAVDSRIIRTYVLVGTELTSLAIEDTDGMTVLTALNKSQMLDLHAALARQLGFTD